MKDLNIQIAIKIYEYEELNAADRELLDAARQATYRSYAPYSHFSVGAAARLANNIIVTGTNQENAAYPSGLCAERTTLFYANSQYPDQAVETLAIAARNERGDHVCHNFNVPFVVVRAISDVADQQSHLSFDEFLAVAAKQSSLMVESLVQKLAHG